ncbi:NAD(P)/FAD-dependent oxidoreductase [Sphingomonas sp. 28-63-12]|uniref:1-hydroxycarotenoid 3,4-desaturase CrtD n=1 Tax=Sphingomonas sp. 28-63-12 TaxID=1970434 RepID=UPI000BD26034|nr:MAG: CrtD protein [Sphingomonas sp. 28-63-12]
MQREQVIVIGAGVGGLTSAALLAAQGLDVTVIEAAGAPGGKMRQVDAGGALVDGGPTVFTMREVFDEIFAACGESLDDHLTLTTATTLARHAWGDDRLDLFADRAQSEAAIAEFAGAQEARGYRSFCAEAEQIFTSLEKPYLRGQRGGPMKLAWAMGKARFADLLTTRPFQTLWDSLGSHFRDPRLRQLFGRYSTYCGSSPYQSPGTLMLIAHVEARGVWLLDGGMHALARALERIAVKNGARFRYGEPVSEILLAGGKASGVVLASGERLAADFIVCNADPAAIADGRFGPAVSHAVGGMTPAQRSLGALVWTAHSHTSGFPLAHHNVFFSDDYAAEFEALAAGKLPPSPTVYICAQDRDDQGVGPAGRERLQILVNAPANGDGPGFTQAEIDQCQAQMLEITGRAGLSLELPPSATVLSTPATFEALFPSTGGALYGRASHGWAASFRRQGARTLIPGIYCAGGSTHPGAGVPMAALSGGLAVDILLKDRASMSRSTRTAMPGGISTPAAKTAASA